MSERIGIFGGTFDPPHLGHLILAAEAKFQLQLSKVLFVLTADPPHKAGQTISPVESRLVMLQAAILGEPGFEISRIEIDRPGPHYAVDTLQLLRQKYPLAALVYLMGGDSLLDLPLDWHQPRAFVAACDEIAVMQRPNEIVHFAQLKVDFPELAAKLQLIDAPLLEISSSQIRKRAQEGNPFRFYLPNAVFNLIQEMRLYQ